MVDNKHLTHNKLKAIYKTHARIEKKDSSPRTIFGVNNLEICIE